MSIVGTLLSAGTSAVSGFSIGTWLKIGAVLAVAATVAGLYWYGQHEADQVTALTKQSGQLTQQIADDKANIDTLKAANDQWAAAFAAYQKAAQAQQAAAQAAQKLQEQTNAQLKAAEALLRKNPQGAAAAFNALDDQLIGVLNAASGNGVGNSAGQVAPGTAGSPAPSAP